MMKSLLKILTGILIVTFSLVIANGALSARPWDASGWGNLSYNNQLSQIASWIANNISQRESVTLEPWESAGYAGLSQAQKESQQMDWQYLKRRATDTEDVIAYKYNERIVNSSSVNEYFVPDKSIVERTDVRSAVVAGQVPDLSIKYCGRSPISLGDDTSCAIKPSGQIYCWGDDAYGQLGNGGGAADSTSPTLVSGGSAWKSLANTGADHHTCAINTSNDLYCWGEGASGKLGDGGTGNNTVPTLVSGGHKWKMAATSDKNSCGITTSGALYCWGEGDRDVNGDGSTLVDRTTPHLVSGGGTWVDVGIGREFACGIKTNGLTYCWGKLVDYPSRPLLGNGTNNSSNVPTLVSGGHTFINIKIGEHHACGLEEDGDLYCWGHGGYGRLGDGSTSNNAVPGIVSGGHKWKENVWSAGEWQTCAIRRGDGKLYCWGYGGNRVIGDGYTITRTVPTASAEPGPWLSVSLAYKFGCGIKRTGGAYCWGRNEHGELGNGGHYGAHELTPNPVVGGHSFVTEYCTL